MKEFLINHFLSYEFIYIFLCCSMVLLLITIFVKYKIIKLLLMPLISLFFILFCFEFCLSFFMPSADIKLYDPYLEKPNEIESVYVKRYCGFRKNGYVDRSLDVFLRNDKWTSLKNKNEYDEIKFVFEVTYTQYNNDVRITKSNEFSSDVYLFLGCSFIFGQGCEDNETLPYYFSKLMDFRANVINLGVVSKGTTTAINILENNIFTDYIKNENYKLNHCFYNLIPDHIFRNFMYDGGRVDGYLYKNNKCYIIPTTISKLKYVFARSYIFRKVFVSVIDDYFKKYYEDYMIKSLEEMNRIVEEKYNSKLTITVWDEKNYSRYFIEKLKETGLDLIWLPDYFTPEDGVYKIQYDGHPTPKANEEIAQMLYNHINGLE